MEITPKLIKALIAQNKVIQETYILELKMLIREVENTTFIAPTFNQQMSQAQFNKCIAKALTYIRNYQKDIHEKQA